jgi:SAM-dependent methyltransferase
MKSTSRNPILFFRALFQSYLRPRGKDAFIRVLRKNSRILDIGSANQSMHRIKNLRPDIEYHGVDIVFDGLELMENSHFYLCNSSFFADDINSIPLQFDAIITSHNLEHCLDPEAVLKVLLIKLKPGGVIYLSFPCEESIKFPSRANTLNFYDDSTHSNLISWSSTIGSLRASGFSILFHSRRYRPLVPFCIGFLLEPLSIIFSRVLPLGITWAYWGFESVIWANKAK